MEFVHGFCVNWDQATHGGFDMNVGFVTDINSVNGGYMRPAAPPTYATIIVVISRVVDTDLSRYNAFGNDLGGTHDLDTMIWGKT